MKKHAKKLLAVLLTLGLLLGLLPTAAFALDEPTHSHDGWVAVTMGETYIKLGEHEQSSNTLTAGSYYLDGDISVPLSVIGEVNLCLNDHDVTVTGNNSRAITITSEATLNLYDCPGTNYGGTVLGQDAGISNNGGTVHVYGGTVTGNSVGIKNNVNSGGMTNFVYVHGGEVNGSYGIQNLSAPCEVHVSGGSVTGSINGIRNMSVYDNKIYLSGTPTISGNRANGHIYTDGSSSPYIYADDGAAENPTPYTGNTIILAYDRLNTSSPATAVCHVTEANKDKFSLTQGDDDFQLEFTKYSSSSAQNDCLKITAITYTVTFNSNGGSAVEAKSVVSGNRVSKPTDPTKSGFVFGGWYSDEELTQAYDFTSSVTDDLTLYAKWSDAPAHTHNLSVDCSTTEGTQVTFQALPDLSAVSLSGHTLSAGSYYLTADAAVGGHLTISGDVTLCLNGHTLTPSGGAEIEHNHYAAISVPQGSSLSVCDCGQQKGKIAYQTAGHRAHAAIGGAGDVTLYGCAVETSKTSAYAASGLCNTGGAFTLYDSHISATHTTSGSGQTPHAYAIEGRGGTTVIHGGTLSATITNGTTYTDGNSGAYGLYLSNGSTTYLLGNPTITTSNTNANNQADVYVPSTSSQFWLSKDSESYGERALTVEVYDGNYEDGGTVIRGVGENGTAHTIKGAPDGFKGTVIDTEGRKDLVLTGPYKVKFDANGGDGTMADQSFTGWTDRKALTANGFTGAGGASFQGWNTKADGTGTSYADGATVSALAYGGSVTLYAQWGAAPAAHTHAVSVGCETGSGTQVEFTAWSTANAMPDTAGNYVLTCDVEMANAWTVPSGTTNLCLNGHVLSHTGSSYVINLQDGRTLNLCDCQTTEHKFTSNDYGNWSLDPDGDKTAAGGVITSCKSPYTSPIGVNIRGGNLTMYGGNIVGNTQGVYLMNWTNLGSFTMEGGSIQGNYGADGGAGVKISGDSATTFTMKGGAIANNTADGRDGGGVCLMKGVFNLEGGSVANNRSLSTSSMGGGVKVSMNGTFNMTGGSITGNSATHGGGIYMNGDAKVTLSGGSITGNQTGYQQFGGGIYYDGAYVNSGYLRLKGAPVIKDNTRGGDGEASDIYLAGGAVMTIGARDAVLARPAKPIVIGASGAKQTVTTVTSDWGNRMYSGEEYKNYANYFKSDSSDYALGLETTHYELTLGPSQVTPTTYTVTFNANGHGTAPASITNVTSGSKITAPTSPTAQGWTFGGWYQEAACTTPWVFETNTVTGNITLYAKWTEVPSNPTYDISGTVTDNNIPVENALVKLMQGNRELGSSITTNYGEYSFIGIEPGSYNVVATSGGKTMTILVIVTSSDLTNQNLVLPAENVNSVLNVAQGTPDVVVGGLEAVADAVKGAETSATSVTVTMTVESKAENDADNAEDIQAAAPGKTLEYLDIKVEKSVDGGASELIPDTGSTVIEIVVPFTFTNRQNVTVYRYHGTSAEALTKNDTKGGGTFRLDTANGLIYIYATKFSTYAIGYTAQSTTPTTPSRPSRPAWPFVDVAEADWCYGGVKYAYENKLMEGTDASHFSPAMDTSRAMVATILWRLAGEPAAKGEAAYPDCEPGAWYAQAVAWGTESGMLKGYGDGSFGPEDPITREQLALMLYRYARTRGAGGIENGTEILRFADTGDVSDWAKEAMTWAVDKGIVAGKGGDILDPQGGATRAETATVLMRFCEQDR